MGSMLHLLNRYVFSQIHPRGFLIGTGHVWTMRWQRLEGLHTVRGRFDQPWFCQKKKQHLWSWQVGAVCNARDLMLEHWHIEGATSGFHSTLEIYFFEAVSLTWPSILATFFWKNISIYRFIGVLRFVCINSCFHASPRLRLLIKTSLSVSRQRPSGHPTATMSLVSTPMFCTVFLYPRFWSCKKLEHSNHWIFVWKKQGKNTPPGCPW